jgi:DNA modification methylase
MMMIELNKIYNEDCLEGMKRIPDGFVDLTVTSPPYDNLRTYNGNIDQWNFEKFQGIARELYRVTKQGGVVVWVVGDATIKGSETGTSFRQALYFKEIGFNLHDTMIYEKLNPMPKNDKRYEPAFEYMFIFTKGKIKTFNPILLPCKYAGKKMSGTQYTANGALKKKWGSGEPVKKTKVKSNIWAYPVGNGRVSHPAIFPEQLANDHIISWSNEGDAVLDPFMGSGTTAIACINTGRNYIGFELDKHYCDIANERIRKAIADKPERIKALYDSKYKEVDDEEAK